MKTLDDLQEFLRGFCKNVYYQPPESYKMEYPAIVFSKKEILNIYANNRVYRQSYFYQVTVIDEEPESEIVKQISLLPQSEYDRTFKSDNLYHDVFTLQF